MLESTPPGVSLTSEDLVCDSALPPADQQQSDHNLHRCLETRGGAALYPCLSDTRGSGITASPTAQLYCSSVIGGRAIVQPRQSYLRNFFGVFLRTPHQQQCHSHSPCRMILGEAHVRHVKPVRRRTCIYLTRLDQLLSVILEVA